MNEAQRKEEDRLLETIEKNVRNLQLTMSVQEAKILRQTMELNASKNAMKELVAVLDDIVVLKGWTLSGKPNHDYDKAKACLEKYKGCSYKGCSS